MREAIQEALQPGELLAAAAALIPLAVWFVVWCVT